MALSVSSVNGRIHHYLALARSEIVTAFAPQQKPDGAVRRREMTGSCTTVAASGQSLQRASSSGSERIERAEGKRTILRIRTATFASPALVSPQAFA